MKKLKLTNTEISNVAKALVDFSFQSNSSWISFDQLKRMIPENLEYELNKAIDAGVIIQNDDNYTFAPEIFQEVLIGLK